MFALVILALVFTLAAMVPNFVGDCCYTLLALHGVNMILADLLAPVKLSSGSVVEPAAPVMPSTGTQASTGTRTNDAVVEPAAPVMLSTGTQANVVVIRRAEPVREPLRTGSWALIRSATQTDVVAKVQRWREVQAAAVVDEEDDDEGNAAVGVHAAAVVEEEDEDEGNAAVKVQAAAVVDEEEVDEGMMEPMEVDEDDEDEDEGMMEPMEVDVEDDPMDELLDLFVKLRIVGESGKRKRRRRRFRRHVRQRRT